MNVPHGSVDVISDREIDPKILLLRTLLVGKYSRFQSQAVDVLQALERFKDFRSDHAEEIDKIIENGRTTFNTVLIEKFRSTMIGTEYIFAQELLHLEELFRAATLQKETQDKISAGLKSRLTVRVTQDMANLRWRLEECLSNLTARDQDEDHILDITSMSDPHTPEELLELLKYWKIYLTHGGVGERDSIAGPVFEFFKLSDEDRYIVLKIMTGWEPEIIN